MDIIFITYFMALIVMIAGLLEFQIMRGYTGEMYYKDFYITNAKQVIQATKALFDENESLYVAFSYSFVFLSAIILTAIYAYINNYMTTAAWIWVYVSIGLILLHVLVPYKLTYINFALDAMKKDVDFEFFINNNLMFFKKKKDLETIKVNPEEAKKIKEEFNSIKFNDYDKYIKIVEKMQNYRINRIQPLPKNIFQKFIGSFQENELIVWDENEHTESIMVFSNKIVFIEADPTMKNIFFKMFVPQSFTTLLLIRFAEVPLYFIIFMFLLKNQGGY